MYPSLRGQRLAKHVAVPVDDGRPGVIARLVGVDEVIRAIMIEDSLCFAAWTVLCPPLTDSIPRTSQSGSGVAAGCLTLRGCGT